VYIEIVIEDKLKEKEQPKLDLQFKAPFKLFGNQLELNLSLKSKDKK
jgi:hypothetical protein